MNPAFADFIHPPQPFQQAPPPQRPPTPPVHISAPEISAPTTESVPEGKVSFVCLLYTV